MAESINNAEGLLTLTACLYPECATPSIRKEHFESQTYRELWEIFDRLKARGESWDLAILYGHGGVAVKGWIRDVNPDWFVTKALAPKYAEMVRNDYRLRLSANVMQEIQLETGRVDPVEFNHRLMTRLVEDEVGDSTISMKEISSQIFDRLEKIKSGSVGVGVPSGMSLVDDYFNGFQPSTLYVLAARPSMGKSALMLNFAMNAARKDFTVYVQCLEESLSAFSTRALSNMSKIQNEDLRRGTFPDHQWEAISARLSQMAKLPFYVNDKANITADRICQNIRTAHAKAPISIAFVDHLQDIKHRSSNWHQDISEAMGLFKDLAKDLKIPVVIISQLSRTVEQAADKRPNMSHLKESGDIEGKADVVMFLFRQGYYKPDYDQTEVELAVAKNRDGKTGRIVLNWDAAFMKFTDRL